MPEQLLTILKICLLALLYLFFFRVLRAVWAETSDPEALTARARVPAPVRALAGAAAPSAPRRRGRRTRTDSPPSELVVLGGDADGTAFPIGETLLIGRAADCHITIAESFVSSYHAQVKRTSQSTVVEDLGSTNGTYVNRARIDGPTVLQDGDVVGVGNVELRAR